MFWLSLLCLNDWRLFVRYSGCRFPIIWIRANSIPHELVGFGISIPICSRARCSRALTKYRIRWRRFDPRSLDLWWCACWRCQNVCRVRSSFAWTRGGAFDGRSFLWKAYRVSAYWMVIACEWVPLPAIAAAMHIPGWISCLLFFLRCDSRRGSSSWLEVLLARVLTMLMKALPLRPEYSMSWVSKWSSSECSMSSSFNWCV